ncbi:acyltransferase family protein [Streptomonospora sp. PA3]|uniref:acyltransferase family protein n=1 Tax=Streptomonospora sp. PA3 TaxID=2607326 RepID=UPI0031B9AEB1
MSTNLRSASSLAAAPSTSTSTGSARRFLPEVQGLRAVAVALVLVYHVDHDLLPGGYVGVDVFFVISGFLITSLLLREARGSGRVALGAFYVRRIRRILPAAGLVLAVTGLVSLWALPSPRLAETARELVASAFYVENLFLADKSVDYLAAESAASPVQHYWSLAVEEQFYLLWPLLFAGWAVLGLRGDRRLGGEGAVLAATGAVLVVSFGFSVVLTATEPQPAYFLPQTRMWELALGGVLAILLPRWGAGPLWVRWVLGWAGLAAIGWAAWTYSGATAFPGVAALVPVLGAAAVIAAGENGARWSTYRLLAGRPARFGGDISYALYLWHWPVIVFALSMAESDSLPPLWAVPVVAVSVLLAWGTKVAVEDPVRRYGWLRTGRAAGIFAVAAALLVALVGVGQYVRHQWLGSVEFDPVQHVGPAAMGTSEPEGSPGVPIYPSPVVAGEDVPDTYEECGGASTLDTLDCVYGPAGAGTTVALVGDSHAAQWIPALRSIAEDRGWRLHVYAKSSCAYTLTTLERNGRDYTECVRWNEKVQHELTTQVRPDVVLTSSSANARAAGSATESESSLDIAVGMTRLWGPLEDSGSHVVAIRDTPRMAERLPECVSRHAGSLSECARAPEDAFANTDPQLLAARNDPDAAVVDLTDSLCTGDTCLPVIGNVLVYRDSHHLTATYSRLLAPDLRHALDAALAKE